MIIYINMEQILDKLEKFRLDNKLTKQQLAKKDRVKKFSINVLLGKKRFCSLS